MPIFPCPPAALAALAKADPALGAAMERLGAVERSVIPDLFTALVDAIAGQQISGAAQRTVMARLFAAAGEVSDMGAGDTAGALDVSDAFDSPGVCGAACAPNRGGVNLADSTCACVCAQPADARASACVQRVDVHTVAAAPLLSTARVLAASDETLRACGLSVRKVAWLRAAAQTVQSGALDAQSLSMLSDEAVIARLTALPGVGVWTAEMLLLFCLQRPDVLSWGDFGIRRGLCLVHGQDALTKEQFAHWRALYSPYGSAASLYLWEVSGETP